MFQQNKRPRRSWVTILLVTTVSFIFLFYFLFISAVFFAKTTLFSTLVGMMPSSNLSGINILVFGVDDTADVQRSDTIIVVHLNQQKNHIGVLSIPRDTRTVIPGRGVDKVNHAYAYGGADLLKKTVSSFLNVPIDYHFEVRLNAVKGFIDKIGGVEINVEKDLFYSDVAGGLYIDLKKGKQTLSGEQALQYVRFRHDNQGDIGRINRQQVFLRAVAEKILTKQKLLEVPIIIKQLNASMTSDMPMVEMLGLSTQVAEAIRGGRVKTASVPGAITLNNGVSYWRPDITGMDRLVQNVLFGFDKKKVAKVESKAVVKTKDKTASKEQRRRPTIKEVSRITQQKKVQDTAALKDVSIEVLNGLGVAGQARVGARAMKELGLKVARFGNAGAYDYPETLIVDWHGKLDKTVILAGVLGIDPSNIIVYDRPNKSIEATLVLGQDWPKIHNELAK